MAPVTKDVNDDAVPRNVLRLRSKSAPPAPPHRFDGRREGESDEAYALRRRHHVALEFARWLVSELERLGPLATRHDPLEPDPWSEWLGGDAAKLADLIASVEQARSHFTGDDTPRRIAVVRDALELAHGRLRIKGRRPAKPSLDIVIAFALGVASELAPISAASWQSAIVDWPGLPQGRGGSRKKGQKSTTWYDVIYRLLKPHALTNASSAIALSKTFESGTAKRQRPSRAK